MTVLGRLFGWDRPTLFGDEQRATLREPPDWLWDAWAGDATYTGKRVTDENAMGLVAVFAAVRLLANAVRPLPLVVYRQNGDERDRARDSRLWSLLHDQPNPEMPAGELWQNATGHLALRGNAYLFKQRDRGGRVVELWPLNPAQVRVGRVNGQRVFEVTGTDGSVTAGSSDDILHLRALSTDGLVGYSPITLARQMLGTAMASEEYRARFYANSAQPAGVLQTDRRLNPEAAKRLAASWRSAHQGLENAAKVAVLEDGVTWQSIGLSLDDQQFIEQQRFDVQQIARLFQVPPSLLNAATEQSLTYSTTELEAIQFVTFSLAPWLATIEQHLNVEPALRLERNLFCEFLIDGLLRADTKTRYEAYEIGIRAGFLRRSEVRQRENLPAVEGIDDQLPPVTPAPPTNGRVNRKELPYVSDH